MPGAPPSSTIEPFTKPPPRTRSNSPIPVLYLTSASTSISESSSILSVRSAVFFEVEVFEEVICSTSSKLFHEPQSGHLPFHFPD